MVCHQKCIVLCVALRCLFCEALFKSQDGQGAITAKAGNVALTTFPFPYILVSHVPKTGGTTLRLVLRKICHLRNQSLEVCYNSEKCDDGHGIGNILSREPSTAPFDGLKTNQVVMGHGVTRNLERVWGLDPSKVAHVAMVRNPIALLLSHFVHDSQQGNPKIPSNLDDYVNQGHTKRLVGGYMGYYLPDFTEADYGDLAGLKRRLQATWGDGRSLLMLMENYEVSIASLADFLGASVEEKQVMVNQSFVHRNRPPANCNLTFHHSSWLKFNQEIQPLQVLYDMVALYSPEPRSHTAPSHTAHQEGDLVRLTIALGTCGSKP